MLKEIHVALAEAIKVYADTRIYYCRVEATALAEGRCTLSGAVLDETTLAALLGAVAARFPNIRFDAGQVQVLRRAEPRVLVVATNVTGLHAQPSFDSELASQLLNGWPLEVLMGQERWCFVRQTDGYLGWAYRPYLAPVAARRPTHIISEPISLLRTVPAVDTALVSRIPGGTAVQAVDSRNGWVRLSLAGGLEGWVTVKDLRALTILPTDAPLQREQIVTDAARYAGVPYLWGGCTALGIDCSGFAQLLHRLAGVTIPRDADMQHDAGRPVDFPFQPGDLLFFGEPEERRKITHVAVSLGGWRIAHSSRSRNGVYEDDVQAVDHLRESFIDARTCLRE